MSNTPPVSVVTGANSGIGRATAIHLARQGHRVVGTVRSIAKADKLQAMADDAGVDIELFELDVADDESVRDGLRRDPRRDRSCRPPREQRRRRRQRRRRGVPDRSCTSSVMNVNLCGAVRCLQAVLPQMRERGSGTIVNITSVAGRIAALAQSPYVASKWAFEGLSEGLAQELAPFGIRVVIIEPGVTKSAIFAKNIDAPNSTGVYEAHYRRMFQFYATGMANATDPFEVAEVIHEAITTDEHRASLSGELGWRGTGRTPRPHRRQRLDRPGCHRGGRRLLPALPRRVRSRSALTDSSTAPLRILTVCSHNRTRSVMMAALFESMLTERLGAGRRPILGLRPRRSPGDRRCSRRDEASWARRVAAPQRLDDHVRSSMAPT